LFRCKAVGGRIPKPYTSPLRRVSEKAEQTIIKRAKITLIANAFRGIHLFSGHYIIEICEVGRCLYRHLTATEKR